MDRLKDKVCVITGADGGICHKASEFFCGEGAKVVMVDIDPAVEAKCAEIVANGGDAIAITADVSKRETWHLILEKTLEKYGTVDCVVNGAAAFSGYKDVFNGQPDEEWEHVLDVNLNSLRFSIEVMYKWMTKNGVKGNFINFSSATALSFMSSGCQAYPITKAGTKLVTQDMAASTASPPTSSGPRSRTPSTRTRRPPPTSTASSPWATTACLRTPPG